MRILITMLFVTVTISFVYGQGFDLPEAPKFDMPGSGENGQAGEIAENQRERAKLKERQRKKEMRREMKARKKMSEEQLERVRNDIRKDVRNEWLVAYDMVSGKVNKNKLSLPENFKAVAEVTVPKTDKQMENQNAELDFFASQGYDTVLVVWKGEKVRKMESLVDSLKYDWNIIFTHGPGESGGTAYVSLDKWKKLMQSIAQDIDVLLPMWRMSSQPHYDTSVEPEKRIAVMAKYTHNVVPDLPVFGEVYMKASPETAIVDGVSGAVLHNAGNIQVMEGRMVKRAKEATGISNIIPSVVGPRPYYDSYDKRDISFSTQWNMKNTCADNYLEKNARGVIVLVGDGAGNRKQNKSALTKTEWRNLYEENQ